VRGQVWVPCWPQSRGEGELCTGAMLCTIRHGTRRRMHGRAGASGPGTQHGPAHCRPSDSKPETIPTAEGQSRGSTEANRHCRRTCSGTDAWVRRGPGAQPNCELCVACGRRPSCTCKVTAGTQGFRRVPSAHGSDDRRCATMNSDPAVSKAPIFRPTALPTWPPTQQFQAPMSTAVRK